MYKIIISGKAANCSAANSNTESKRKVNRILFEAQVKFLNFKAKRSILDTRRSEKMTVIAARTKGLKTKSKKVPSRNGSPVIKIAFAGVGNPLKASDWVSSRLKTASRMPEQTAIRIPR